MALGVLMPPTEMTPPDPARTFSKQLACGLAILCGAFTMPGAEFVSNLGNLWTNAGIGPVHALLPGNGGFEGSFYTGVGGFRLNSATFEFLAPSSAVLDGVDVRLYKVIDLPFPQASLIATLDNPTVDPRPTQWPPAGQPYGYTQFIDYFPIGEVDLESNTHYVASISVPASNSVIAEMLFTESHDYFTPTDWQITSPNPAVLKFAIDATIIPEPGKLTFMPALLLLGLGLTKHSAEGRSYKDRLAAQRCRRRLTGRKQVGRRRCPARPHPRFCRLPRAKRF